MKLEFNEIENETYVMLTRLNGDKVKAYHDAGDFYLPGNVNERPDHDLSNVAAHFVGFEIDETVIPSDICVSGEDMQAALDIRELLALDFGEGISVLEKVCAAARMWAESQDTAP